MLPVSAAAAPAPELDMARPAASQDARPGFADHLKASLNLTNELQATSHTAMQELAAGQNGNIHETLLAMNKAEVAFKMVMQVRNKLLNAYQEVMRMQV